MTHIAGVSSQWHVGPAVQFRIVQCNHTNCQQCDYSYRESVRFCMDAVNMHDFLHTILTVCVKCCRQFVTSHAQLDRSLTRQVHITVELLSLWLHAHVQVCYPIHEIEQNEDKREEYSRVFIYKRRVGDAPILRWLGSGWLL